MELKEKVFYMICLLSIINNYSNLLLRHVMVVSAGPEKVLNNWHYAAAFDGSNVKDACCLHSLAKLFMRTKLIIVWCTVNTIVMQVSFLPLFRFKCSYMDVY